MAIDARDLTDIKQIKKYAANPSSIDAPGSYGEGQMLYISKMLESAKKAVAAGKLSITEYTSIAEPLVTYGKQTVNPKNFSYWSGIVNGGFASSENGKMTLPFTKQEYAKLPDKILPTQADVTKGTFDPNLAPLQRFAPGAAPKPQVNPGPGGTVPGQVAPPSTPVPINQTGTSPVFTANPNAPAPYGGLGNDNSQAAQDAQKIAQEAALQQQLSATNQEAITAKRQKYLQDLSGILTAHQNQQFKEDNPAILEDLNSRGLLRSSELGNALAREQKSLEGTTATNLAQYGLQGDTADLSNLQGIQQTYNQARNSALQRQFSVEDYQKQIQAGKDMGAQYASLTPNQGKSGSPVTTAAIGAAGTLGGAALAGPIGGKIAGSAATAAVPKG